MKAVFERLYDSCTWENVLGMLDFVEVLPSTSLNFQTTEEKQYGD